MNRRAEAPVHWKGGKSGVETAQPGLQLEAGKLCEQLRALTWLEDGREQWQQQADHRERGVDETGLWADGVMCEETGWRHHAGSRRVRSLLGYRASDPSPPKSRARGGVKCREFMRTFRRDTHRQRNYYFLLINRPVRILSSQNTIMCSKRTRLGWLDTDWCCFYEQIKL